MGRIAKVLAEGIDGWMKGLQIREGMDKREKDAKFQEDQRDAWRADRDAKTEEKRVLAQAARPVEVEEGAGGAIRPETMDDRDVGLPGEAPMEQGGYRVAGKNFLTRDDAAAAAVQANSPDARVAREAAALRGLGKTTEAMQLETQHTQGKAAKFQLDRDTEKWVTEKFDQQISGAADFQGLADTLTKAGQQVSVVTSSDGKKVQLVRVGADGQQIKLGAEYDPKDIDKAKLALSKGIPVTAKISAMQGWAQLEQADKHHTQRLDQADRHFNVSTDQRDRHHKDDVGLRRETLAESRRHNQVAEGISSAQLKIAQRKADEDHKLPPATKTALANMAKAMDSMDAAMNKAQADGTWDGASDNAKALLARRASLATEYQRLLTPYLDSEGKGGKGGATVPPKPGFDDFAAGLPDPKGTAPGAVSPAAGAAPGGASNIANAPPGGVTNVGGKWVANGQGPASAALAQAAPVPAAAAAPAAATPGRVAAAVPAQQQDPLLAALGATGDNTVSQVVARNAPVIRQAAESVKAAQAQVVQAAQSQDPKAVQAAVQAADAAGRELQAILSQMEPGMAQRVRQAVGL